MGETTLKKRWWQDIYIRAHNGVFISKAQFNPIKLYRHVSQCWNFIQIIGSKHPHVISTSVLFQHVVYGGYIVQTCKYIFLHKGYLQVKHIAKHTHTHTHTTYPTETVLSQEAEFSNVQISQWHRIWILFELFGKLINFFCIKALEQNRRGTSYTKKANCTQEFIIIIALMELRQAQTSASE